MIETRYDIVNSRKIINFCDSLYLPEIASLYNNWHNNPIRFYVRRRYIELFDEKVGHFKKLFNSIKKEGVRNPVMITSGTPYFRKLSELSRNTKGNLYCEYLGGSRLMIAQYFNLDVKCIITDKGNIFKNSELIKTPEELLNKFSDGNEFRVVTKNDGTFHVYPKQFHHLNNEKYTLQEQSKVRREIINQIKQEIGK